MSQSLSDRIRQGFYLRGSLRRVFLFIGDGRRVTLRQVSEACNIPETSASARLRDLRKRQYGGFTVGRIKPATGPNHYALFGAAVL